MTYPVIAIVGRPNTGKSTLFNRLIKQKKSIIDNTPGVTRDRIYGICSWNDRGFIIIDTGGLDTRPNDSVSCDVHEHALSAIKEADVVLFLMDGKEGLLPLDEEIFLELKKGGIPLLCVINKIDNDQNKKNIIEFYSLPIDILFPISATHGLGIEALMEKVVELLPNKLVKPDQPGLIRLAIIGRPNVGKSSLLNKILRTQRAIVSEIPGTTRDCIDTLFNYNHRSYIIIDTAGLRRQKSVKDRLEKISVIKTIKNIENCDIALLLIDAQQDIAEQDVRIAGIAHQAGKGIVIVVNKWDTIVKDDKTIKRFEEGLRSRLKYLSFAPMIFVSALTGQRIYKIFSLVEKVYDQYNTRVSTGTLNRAIRESMEKFLPPRHHGKRVKIYYQTQIGIKPPTFVFFANYPEGIKFTYERYLQNQIREKLGLSTTPIRIIFRAKTK